MHAPRPVQLTVAVLALAGSAVLLWRSLGPGTTDGADVPQGTLWVCRNAACRRDFTLSTHDLGAFYQQHPEGSPPCPVCAGTDTARAIRCAGCGKAFVPPARSSDAGKIQPRVCPHCGKPIG